MNSAYIHSNQGSEKMRVLALSDHLGHKDGKIHGGTTYFTTVYPELVKAGINLTACFMADWHPAAEKLTAGGVDTVFLKRGKYDPRVFLDVKNIIGKKKIQLVHLASYKSHFLGRLVASARNVKTVIHLHDSVKMPFYVKALQRMVANRTDRAIAVSNYIKKYGIKEYYLSPDIVSVLHNAIDIESFQHSYPGYREALCQELEINPGKIIIAVIGRLAEMKGQDHALRAMKILVNKYRDVVLVLIGEGPKRIEYEALAEKLGLKNVVRFTGQRNDIPKVLSAIDIVIMPSIYGEGIGFSAIEAIAAGKPVVAYDMDGIPEVALDNYCGVVVPIGDIQGLADALFRLLNDQQTYQRMVEGAFAHAKNFALVDHVDKLVEIYRSLM